jgi:hypothetical protein
MDRPRTVITDFLSVPKIIGMGPIITTPPPFNLLLLPLTPFEKSRIKAIKIIAKPEKTKVNPITQSGCSLINVTTQKFLQVELNKGLN